MCAGTVGIGRSRPTRGAARAELCCSAGEAYSCAARSGRSKPRTSSSRASSSKATTAKISGLRNISRTFRLGGPNSRTAAVSGKGSGPGWAVVATQADSSRIGSRRLSRRQRTNHAQRERVVWESRPRNIG